MLEVRLIGKFEIRFNGEPVTLSTRAAQSLFAFLILTAGTPHRRERLAGIFWPEAPEEKARTYLRQELWRIRSALSAKTAADYLIADDITICFNGSSNYKLDVASLTNLGDRSSMQELISGLACCQGELLPGFYDDWIVERREQQQVLFEKRVEQLLDMLAKEKRWHEILDWAECWIAQCKSPEAAYQYLMHAYESLGDRARVAATYERCVQALREIDLEPSEETRALLVKRNYKINIPIPLTSFIGRKKEMKEIADLLSKSRLVTLTGSGGVGKTRLAIQVVTEVLDFFQDGVWFLDFAPLTDTALLANTLANSLGLRESRDLSITDLLIHYLRFRTALLIFDNCEHLIESCAQLVYALLTSCQNITILATSRESLRVSGEIPYRVPSLEIPNLNTDLAIDEVSKIESVRLFIERATFASLGFAINSQNALAVAQICQRLDGIPLAIELAAARTNVLPVQQILQALDDRFNLLTYGLRSGLPRHQTLRAMIEWSYDLLSNQEQLLFRRLAVFVNSWTLDAVEDVCTGNGIQVGEVFDLLTQLINKSIMLAENKGGQTRYHMLETIRQFAHMKMVESDEVETLHDRHLKYFLQLSELAESGLKGPAQVEWYQRLMDERDNIRSALYWADKTDIEAGLYISSRMERFWRIFDVREGNYWLSKFLQRPEARTYPEVRAKALKVYGWILISLQQFDAAHIAADECIKLYRTVGDQYGEVDALLLRGVGLSDATQKLGLAKKALELAQLLGDLHRQAEAWERLGWIYQDERMFVYWKKAIEHTRLLEDWYLLAAILSTTGLFLVLNGEIESAEGYLDEANTLYQQLNIKPATANLLSAYGQIALMRGNFEKARSYFREAAKLGAEFGSQQDFLWSNLRLGYVAMHEGILDEARQLFTESAINFQKDYYTVGIIFALEGLASLNLITNKPKRAARLIGWADANRGKIGDYRWRVEQADVDKTIATCIMKMGEAAFSNAYDEGKEMSLDEAVTYAIENT